MTWEKPLATTGAYLDALDDGGVPAAARCIAALGPRMLELARDRTAGAHPYLVTPEHTATARNILGNGFLLAAELSGRRRRGRRRGRGRPTSRATGSPASLGSCAERPQRSARDS